ncbi:uncharacterized protein LOC131938108 [Physella acuta]|uniref:uncharacterized protein LOC131938108 n=1 Tax=Physella acuta TaxID=109671 RepID=UPI0027DE5DB1|nr:uncharacterized protein LOC131938108 [Physella acuta]
MDSGLTFDHAEGCQAIDGTAGKKNDQGNYECEVLLEGAESGKLWETCVKNPGHVAFIPAQQFSLEHLPGDYQDTELLDFVHKFADRAVRLVVNYTSMARPDGFIFSNHRGTTTPHTGSGFMTCRIWPTVNEDEKQKSENKSDSDNDSGDDDDFEIIESFDLNQLCPCPECSESDDPNYGWGYVYVETSRHVVFDDEEAKNTVIYYNYTDEFEFQKLYGIKISWSVETKDWCTLECVTHDRELYAKLYNSQQQIDDQYLEINEKYWQSPSRLAIIFSHPHGYAKRITVGQWVERRVTFTDHLNGDIETTYTYNNATCSGSSGAPVLIFGKRGDDDNKVWWQGHFHAHGGWMDKDTNFSGISDERIVELED